MNTHSALLSSLMFCGCEEASDRPLKLFVGWSEYKWVVSPFTPLCTSQLLPKEKETVWLKHISFSSRVTLLDFLSFHSFLSGLPLLVQLVALRPQEAIRHGKTSPDCFNEIPRVCLLLNEPRTDTDFLRAARGHFHLAVQARVTHWQHLWHLISAA